MPDGSIPGGPPSSDTLMELARVEAALAGDPGLAMAHNSRGVTLLNLGRTAEAARSFQRATALNPGCREAHANHALVLRRLGRLQDAALVLAMVVALDPRDAAAWREFALLLRRLRHPEAEAALRGALAQAPADPMLAAELGLLRIETGRDRDATAPLRRAIALRPDLAPAHTGLGAALQAQDQMDAAMTALHRAMRLRPLDPAPRAALGGALRTLGRKPEADAVLRQALAAAPAAAPVYANLGALRLDSQDRTEAATTLGRALTLDPALHEARLNRGLLRLARGNLSAGWKDYAARLALRRRAVPQAVLPEWRGGGLAGRTLLMTPEQGVGDELMFASCLPDLIARAGLVIVECDPRLVTLFARSFPGALVRPTGATAPDEADLRVSAGSLPGLLRDRLGAFPAGPGWLVPDPIRLRLWGTRLAALGPGLRVGLCWRSGLMTTGRRAAYTRLSDWAPLFDVPGLRLVTLQYGDAAAEMDEAERRFGVRLHRWDDLDLKDDFENMAALTAALDLVIAPAVSGGELAGALGTPVWRVGAPDWTQLGTGIRPWYPAMRLFQPRPGETVADVPARIAAALRTMC